MVQLANVENSEELEWRMMSTEITIDRKRVAEWLTEADRRVVVMQGTRSLILIEVGCEYKIGKETDDIITVLKAIKENKPKKKLDRLFRL